MKTLNKSSLRSHFPHHLFISDVLLLNSEEEEALIFKMKERSGKGCAGGVFDCASPRRIVERIVGGLRRRKLEKEVEIEVGSESKRGSEEVDQFLDARDSSSSTAVASNDPLPERCGGRDFAFNLGVGGCLLYLIAASKTELDKMIDLRGEMEEIVRRAKQESQRKDEISNTPETNEISVYTAASKISESNGNRSPPFPDSEAEGMKQLEAELEVELERLQLCLDSEKLNNPIQETLDVIHDEEENSSARYSSFSSSEVIDPRIETQAQEICSVGAQLGVSPIELERRLHELLESRQQEQIRELEIALELANDKLREKEAEILWWKDTSRLLSQHVSEPPRPFRNK